MVAEGLQASEGSMPDQQRAQTLGIEWNPDSTDDQGGHGLYAVEEGDEDASAPAPPMPLQQRLAQAGQRVLANPVYTGLMLLLTLYALFGSDIRILAFEKDADDTFFALSAFTFFAFCFDLVLASAVRSKLTHAPGRSANACQRQCRVKGYFLSFFFWLDFVAALSVITEIPWIWEPIGAAMLAFRLKRMQHWPCSMLNAAQEKV